MKTRKPKLGRRRSPVARHMESFNKPATHRDRKRAAKRGHRKHKGGFE